VVTTEPEYEIVTQRVCRDCGAGFTTPGIPARHAQATGHSGGFRAVKVRRPKLPTRISYQPGYGPTTK